MTSREKISKQIKKGEVYVTGLKKMLAEERDRLEKVIKSVQESLIGAPEGGMRISVDKGQIRYYLKMNSEEKEKYIPSKEVDLPVKLAQKAYDEKILHCAKHRIGQINRILTSYEDDEIEKIYLNQHLVRQSLVKPVEPTWEQLCSKWLEQEYVGKEFQEGTPVILTAKGERVRSKSEKILADYFYSRKIPYHYEKPLHLRGYGIVYPDFTLLSRKTRREVYWEHEGMMDKPEYARAAVRKIETYQRNGIYPGECLILTFETEKSILNTDIIEGLVEKYL